jgi:hypothetical protein
MRYRIGFVVCALLLIAVFSPAAAQDATPEVTPPVIDYTPPTLGSFDPASVQEFDLNNYPILPELTANAKAIYAAGQANGNNPQVFSKVGDCMTASQYFMVPFGQVGTYDLAADIDLQPVIDYFSAAPARAEGFQQNSFNNPGLATASGFNTASVLDPIWSNPQWCQPNESPLSCEYRESRPAFALIMFGTNDVYVLEAPAFDFYMRTIVLQTIQSNIVPILYTFPSRPEFPDKTLLFNKIVLKIAQNYDLPIVNLWKAIKDLPNGGVDPVQPIHLSIPPDEKTGDFVHNMDYGYTIRNRITLQTLKELVTALGVELK